MIKVLFGLGLLIGLTTFVDYDRLLASIRTADQQLLLAGLLLFSMQGVFESGRLKIVFADFNISFPESVRLFFVGMFFGNFMPGMIGADIYQVHYMHRVRRGLLRPLSLSLFLRLSGLINNILLAAVALALSTKIWIEPIDVHLNHMAIPDWILITALIVLLVFAAMMASLPGRNYLRFLYGKISEALQEFFQVVRSFSIIEHASIGVLGVLVILSRAASFYILVQAFGFSISSIDVILVVTVTALAMLLPISFAGLGVREISATAMLIAFGIAPPEAVAISLVSRCFIWILSLVGGAWFILNKTITKAGI